MKHYYVYDVPYLEFNEKNNALKSKYKCLKKEMPKGKFAMVVIANVLVALFVCALLTTFNYCAVIYKGGNTILALLASSSVCGLLGTGICCERLYDYNYYIRDYEKYLIDKLFSEEIRELNWLSVKEVIKAEQWRLEHPLEEKCRLALTKNPNYVADLIKYVKENKQ